MERYARTCAPDARIASLITWLGRIGWAVLVVALAAHQAAETIQPGAGQTVVVAGLAVFFLILIARLVCATWLYRDRRASLGLLVGAVLLWATGSFSVNATSINDLTRFPAPGEWLFLASYLGFVGYLILDATRHTSRPLTDRLDVIVICGGTACLAASLLLTPAAIASGQRGAPLLLALLYPIMDVGLALLVLAQVVLRARTERASTVALGAGLLLLGAADSAFVIHVSSSTYQFSTLAYALWGTGFALIVAAACRPKSPVLSAVPRGNAPGAMMLPAGIIAVVALSFDRPGALSPYITCCAVATLLAAGARMALALREANKAAEAFALSQTDDLTKLPNRRAVRRHLSTAIETAAPLGLMLLDLDGFKEINDTLGHAAGDTVLQLAAHRMRSAFPADVLVARLGGDEFAIAVATDDEIALMEMAQNLLTELAKPIRVDGIEVAPSASIGIATASRADTAGSEVMRRADVAMYQAKNRRRGAALYDHSNDEFSRPRLQLAEELRKGIAEGQIELWYQPQVSTDGGEVCGLEALVRWIHPTQGVQNPVTFLPAARRAGLMGILSEAVASLAVRDLSRWLQAGLDVRTAINCAPPELLSKVFIPRLYAEMSEWLIPAERMVVEVTEDSFLAEPDRARTILDGLRDHGVQVAIDDYGTGFSSLAYLRDLPVHELKIDRSFVRGLLTDERSRIIVASTIQMAHGLGLRIVAEGVEDRATADALAAMGADVLQGYHIAKPMPAGEIEAWLRNWKPGLVISTVDDLEHLMDQPEREPNLRSGGARTTRVRSAHRSVPARRPAVEGATRPDLAP